MVFWVCCGGCGVSFLLSHSLKYLWAQGGQVHNTCTCTLLDLKLLLSLDRTSKEAPQPTSSLIRVSQPSSPFPPLPCFQLLHQGTDIPRWFPPWPLTLPILAQALPPQLLSQDVPHLSKLSEPTPFANGGYEFLQLGPSELGPGSPPAGSFLVHST